MKKTFIIGVDSGGSKIRIKILFPHLSKVITKTVTSFHLNVVGLRFFSEFLLTLLSSLLRKNKLIWNQCKGLCIAVAGGSNVRVRNEIKNNLRKRIKLNNIIVISDAEATLFAAFRENDGAVLICGTGSIIYSKFGNKIYRVGGWGRIIGDNGSGFEIGKTVLQNLTTEYDLYNGIAKSNYLIEVERKFKINSKNFIEKIYQRNFNIAKVAKLVINLADKGNRNCKDLLRWEADKLIQQLKIFVKSKNIPKKMNLMLSGGLLENDNYYSKLIKEQIKKKFKDKFTLIEKKLLPVEGAVNLALKEFFNKNIN